MSDDGATKTPKRKKVRADELLHFRGVAESRTKAQAYIMAGQAGFRLNEGARREIIRKAGQELPFTAIVDVDDTANRDVGRGALKLRRAFDAWPLSAVGAFALDIGASTGGFTQVLLERGATRVVALDVGTHQLHERLRADARVLSLEKHHVLKMEAATWAQAGVEPAFDMIVTDVSFISSAKLPSVVSGWMKPGSSWILLVKPQFEVGPKKAPGGIVKNPEYQREAIDGVRSAVEAAGLQWREVIESPIAGGDGNKEFLAWIVKS